MPHNKPSTSATNNASDPEDQGPENHPTHSTPEPSSPAPTSEASDSPSPRTTTGLISTIHRLLAELDTISTAQDAHNSFLSKRQLPITNPYIPFFGVNIPLDVRNKRGKLRSFGKTTNPILYKNFRTSQPWENTPLKEPVWLTVQELRDIIIEDDNENWEIYGGWDLEVGATRNLTEACKYAGVSVDQKPPLKR
ncbi:hypothetical protein CC80DRAFT_544361 [Byssothecium circinans]|uniref:Uncharacterized protein n=1 Tax=Byssothecium circinans TaxID=147558 RepID=A0A6A5U8G3_9PLEO|nr:hypothetical protein CC80DRAFT_544361 [Byssothecium circinans]